MGWRSWNLFGGEVTQKLITSIMDGMVRREHLVDGKPTSLCDLGYCDVGLDDNWQKCREDVQTADAQGTRFHDSMGDPVVNIERFPDFNEMTDHAHKLNLTAGWYGNNCICQEKSTQDEKFYIGDVRALRAYGFDSWKLDGCGPQWDLDLFERLIRSTPRTSGREAILIENCHWGGTIPRELPDGELWCPWHMYRSAGDVLASYHSVAWRLQSTIPHARANLSRPGCWAYPDMLEVGCDGKNGDPIHANDKGLSLVEERTHFAAWAIVSSPLVLSHDVNDPVVTARVWPIISNREVIAINQAWAGHSGSPFRSSPDWIIVDETNANKPYRKVGEILLILALIMTVCACLMRVAALCRCAKRCTTRLLRSAGFVMTERSVELSNFVSMDERSDQPNASVIGVQTTSTEQPPTPSRPKRLGWPPGMRLFLLVYLLVLVVGAGTYAYSWLELKNLLLDRELPWVPKWQLFYKPLEWSGSRVAVLMINHDNEAQDLMLRFEDIPGLSCRRCHVRDVWNRLDLGVYSETYVASNVSSHDAPMLIVSDE